MSLKSAVLPVLIFCLSGTVLCATTTERDDDLDNDLFRRDLIIESPSATPWTGDTMISVDDAGLIYVADLDECHVYVLNSEGHPVGSFVRKGHGPGEFRRMIAFEVLADGRSVGYDMGSGSDGRLIWFDSQRQFEKTTEPEPGKGKLISKFDASPGGERFGIRYASFDVASRRSTSVTALVDPHLNALHVVAREDRDAGGVVKDWSKAVARDIVSFYDQRPHLAFGPGGQVYTTDGDGYRIVKYGEALGQPLWSIERQHKPGILPEQELTLVAEKLVANLEATLPPPITARFPDDLARRAMERLDTTITSPALFGLVASPDHVYVIRKVSLKTRETEADVFDNDGMYLSTIRLPDFGFMDGSRRIRIAFWKDRAYSLQETKDGASVISRYAIVE